MWCYNHSPSTMLPLFSIKSCCIIWYVFTNCSKVCDILLYMLAWYRTEENFGGKKNWQIWQIYSNSPKFYFAKTWLLIVPFCNLLCWKLNVFLETFQGVLHRYRLFAWSYWRRCPTPPYQLLSCATKGSVISRECNLQNSDVQHFAHTAHTLIASILLIVECAGICVAKKLSQLCPFVVSHSQTAFFFWVGGCPSTQKIKSGLATRD